MRWYCTGTSMVWVARWFSREREYATASNLAISTAAPPWPGGKKHTSVVLEYSGVAIIVTALVSYS